MAAVIFTSLECADEEHGSCTGRCAGCEAECLCPCGHPNVERAPVVYEGWAGEPAPETAWFA